MIPTLKPISPLRQRMLDDMAMRKLNRHTQAGYLRAVKQLAEFLGRSPATATAEDLRRFQLHLVASGISSTTLNATITGLRFLFRSHPASSRYVGLDEPGARAADITRRAKCRRGRTDYCRRRQPEVSRGVVGGLRGGVARQRSRAPQSH